MMTNQHITERTIAYAVRIVYLFQALEENSAGRIIGKQLLRAGTSIGANVHEAQGAQSKPDFITKLTIAQKEANESLYWLRIIQETQLVPPQRITDLYAETEQLIKIIASIIVKTRRNMEGD